MSQVNRNRFRERSIPLKSNAIFNIPKTVNQIASKKEKNPYKSPEPSEKNSPKRARPRSSLPAQGTSLNSTGYHRRSNNGVNRSKSPVHMERNQLDKLISDYKTSETRFRSSSKTSQDTLQSLQNELELSKKRNVQLEEFYKFKPKFEEILKERDDLRTKNLDLMNNSMLIEDMTLQVKQLNQDYKSEVKENNDLEARLAYLKENPISDVDYLNTIATKLAPMNSELKQLVSVVKTMKNGTNIDTGLMLRTTVGEEENYKGGIETVLDELRRNLDQMRDFTSDIYGEMCGSKCILN